MLQGIHIPNTTTGSKAAVPQSTNPTTVRERQWCSLYPPCSEEMTGCGEEQALHQQPETYLGCMQGNVVTKAGAVPASGVAGPGAANPLTGGGAEEGSKTAK